MPPVDLSEFSQCRCESDAGLRRSRCTLMIALSFPLGAFCWQNCCHNVMVQKKIRFSAPRVEKSHQSDRLSMLNSPIYELDATKSEPVGNLIGVDPKGK